MTEADGLDALIDQALQMHRNGALDDAIGVYRHVLEIRPGHAEALNFIALALHQQGQFEDALEAARTAVVAEPGTTEFKVNLALIETAAGHFDAALDTLSTLREASTYNPQIENLYAMAAKGAGKNGLATEVLQNLLVHYPDFAGAHYNLGNIHLQMGNLDHARVAFERALAIEPNNADASRNLAQVLDQLGKTSKARDLLEHLLESNPNDALALNNLGNIERKLGDLDAARHYLERASMCDPEMPDAAYNLGAVLADQNDISNANAAFARAHQLRPGFTKAQWASRFTLPQIYESIDHVADARARWIEGIRHVTDHPLPEAQTDQKAHLETISEITPFGLAYHGENDFGLMGLWGKHVSRIAKRTLPGLAEQPSAPARERKRIAFVSAHLRSHTVERLFSAWMTGLNREEFDLHLVSTNGPGDARSKQLASTVDGFHVPPATVQDLGSTVSALRADVVIYPDIGMDPRTQVLAALPLGQHQTMSWGHPVTSGFPDIDMFLTSELMEPPDAEQHYHEQLIRLPGLSVCYPRPDPPVGDTPETAFLCAQSLFKVSPTQDDVFAEILRECPGSKLAFIAHPISQVTSAFRRRLSAALLRRGIDVDETLIFLPPTNRNGFLRYLAGADVILDTFLWSGGNTSLEAFAIGTPVVTLPGRFMRGRHTLAMLKMMEITELRAEDADDYVRIATTLSHDRRLNSHTRNLIRERSDRIFGDRAPIAAITDLLRSI